VEGHDGGDAYWVRETDIDGFRCDVAGKVPTPFWNQARDALDRVKPVFMLAEADKPDLQEHAFDMSYGWDTKDLFKDIAKGKKDARALKDFLAHPPKAFPPGAYRMRFTSNHDENSWAGSDVELYGPAFKAMAVLAATLPGMPLIYGGQEAGLDKRIEFFEKDPIAVEELPVRALLHQPAQAQARQPGAVERPVRRRRRGAGHRQRQGLRLPAQARRQCGEGQRQPVERGAALCAAGRQAAVAGGLGLPHRGACFTEHAESAHHATGRPP
jgi:glycosidase